MHKSKEICSVLIKEKLMELRRNRVDMVRVGVKKIKYSTHVSNAQKM